MKLAEECGRHKFFSPRKDFDPRIRSEIALPSNLDISAPL
jgi:hypothetical protein